MPNRRCQCGHPESDHRPPSLGNRICGPGSCPCAVFRPQVPERGQQ